MAYHILIVDDDRTILESMARLLRFGKYRVSTAFNGAEGIEHAILDRPDLILLDMSMPEMDGRQVIASLRERQAGDIPVILITGNGQAAETAKELGIAAGIDKPCTMPMILKTINRVLTAHGVS